MNRHPLLLVLAAVMIGVVPACLAPAQRTVEAGPLEGFHDDFSGPALYDARWLITRQNDFQESTVDVVDGRLRLRAATIGTDDKTVKFLGVRTSEPVVDLTAPATVAAVLDWNDQANGCYLTAGLYVCPTATDENPRDEPDWLKVEYIGVPPGKNGRCLVARQKAGRLEQLHTEGWPTEQRVGRAIGDQRLRVRFDGPRLEVHENGELLFASDEAGPGFERGYVYLQLSTHSNYPPREVFFDDVLVEPGQPTAN